jgi:hypothetical protein
MYMKEVKYKKSQKPKERWLPGARGMEEGEIICRVSVLKVLEICCTIM